MTSRHVIPRFLFKALLVLLPVAPSSAAQLPDIIPVVKRSVVGIGTQLKMRSPAIVFFGTGFIVKDGLSVVTNAHVVPSALDMKGQERLGIVVGDRRSVEFRPARVVAVDREHDLAHLRIEGEPLPVLTLGEAGQAREGQELAFTGFPLGMVLGLNPATHRATLAAIAPIVTPSLSSRRLDGRAIAQLQRSSFDIYQLDGTAYPGNSGSPVYDPATGIVHAVINMVYVKGLKETAISNPSGITYAIPVDHVHKLLQQK